MPDVSSPHVAVPTDGVRSLRRPTMPKAKSDQAADADFGKQLADMATGDEGAGRSAGAKEGRETPASGWRQWGAKFVRLDGDLGGVPEAAAAKAAVIGEEGSEADGALPAVLPVAIDDSLARGFAPPPALGRLPLPLTPVRRWGRSPPRHRSPTTSPGDRSGALHRAGRPRWSPPCALHRTACRRKWCRYRSLDAARRRRRYNRLCAR